MPFFKNPERPEQNKKITKIVPGHPTGVLSSNYVRGKNQSLFTYQEAPPHLKGARPHFAKATRGRGSFWLYLVSAVVIVVGMTVFYLNLVKKTEIDSIVFNKIKI